MARRHDDLREPITYLPAAACTIAFSWKFSSSRRDDPEESLNTGVSGRKSRSGSKLGEQVHQIRKRHGIELLRTAWISLLRRSSPAKASLSQWNFSTVRSHDMGLAKPPS